MKKTRPTPEQIRATMEASLELPLNQTAEEFELAERTKVMDETLYKEATKPNASWQKKKLWYTRYGLLIEKKETIHKVEITADDHIRIRKEGQKRASAIDSGASRDRSLLPVSTILLEQSKGDDNESPVR